MIEPQKEIELETALRLLIQPRARQILHQIDATSDKMTVDQLENSLRQTDRVTYRQW